MSKITDLLGTQADSLLNHTCKTISKESIVAPNPNFIDQTFAYSNRNARRGLAFPHSAVQRTTTPRAARRTRLCP